MTWEQLDERIREDDGPYPPCEWGRCGEESVIAIVGGAGDIWLCGAHHERWDPTHEPFEEWFCRSLFGLKCSPVENDGRDHDLCGWESV